jgi:hypothetical protein
MEVVEKTLTSLSDRPGLRSCLLDKISASGRGEQDLAETADKSRRAVIKVRVNAAHALDVANAIMTDNAPVHPAAVVLTPAAARVLDLFSKLRAVPRQSVVFRLTDDEVNLYLTYALLTSPRPGIDSIAMKFFPHNYISTLTVIDFDAIERWSPGLVPAFLDLNGKKLLWVDFRFSVGAGTLSYNVEKAFYQNKRIPHFLAEKIIQTIGARQPENAGGTEIATPFGLTRIQTGEHYVEAQN